MTQVERLRREKRVRKMLAELFEPENVKIAVELARDHDRAREFTARLIAAYVAEQGEDATDELVDRLFERIDPPWWVPTGIVRRVLDSKLPEAIVEPVLRLILPEAPDELDLYAVLRP